MAIYDPSDWKIVALNVPLAGFKDGTFLTVSEDVPRGKIVFGTLGDPVVVRGLVASAKVEVTLQREHPCNDALSALYNAWASGDKTVPGLGFLAKHLNSTSFIEAPICLIEKQADMEGAQDPSAIKWTFLLAKHKSHNGGAIL